jgi:hypothetical protein
MARYVQTSNDNYSMGDALSVMHTGNQEYLPCDVLAEMPTDGRAELTGV